jgi:hypothetical protein
MQGESELPENSIWASGRGKKSDLNAGPADRPRRGALDTRDAHP